MAYLNFFLAITFNGIILSIAGVVIERLLVKHGLIRGNIIEVILGCFFIGFIMQITDSERAYLIFWLAAGILAPISLNRIDIIVSLTKGRWWWKSENHHHDS
jgi:hypothetical protein